MDRSNLLTLENELKIYTDVYGIDASQFIDFLSELRISEGAPYLEIENKKLSEKEAELQVSFSLAYLINNPVFFQRGRLSNIRKLGDLVKHLKIGLLSDSRRYLWLEDLRRDRSLKGVVERNDLLDYSVLLEKEVIDFSNPSVTQADYQPIILLPGAISGSDRVILDRWSRKNRKNVEEKSGGPLSLRI